MLLDERERGASVLARLSRKRRARWLIERVIFRLLLRGSAGEN